MRQTTRAMHLSPLDLRPQSHRHRHRQSPFPPLSHILLSPASRQLVARLLPKYRTVIRAFSLSLQANARIPPNSTKLLWILCLLKRLQFLASGFLLQARRLAPFDATVSHQSLWKPCRSSNMSIPTTHFHSRATGLPPKKSLLLELPTMIAAQHWT